MHRAASMYFENIEISQEKLENILQTLKNKKNQFFVNQLVPCAHQLLCDVFLLKKGINPSKDY